MSLAYVEKEREAFEKEHLYYQAMKSVTLGPAELDAEARRILCAHRVRLRVRAAQVRVRQRLAEPAGAPRQRGLGRGLRVLGAGDVRPAGLAADGGAVSHRKEKELVKDLYLSSPGRKAGRGPYITCEPSEALSFHRSFFN